MDRGVRFSAASARRVGKAVRSVEQRNRAGATGWYRQRHPRGEGGDDVVWGEVTIEISARPADWSAPGSGTVQLKKPNGLGGMENDGDPVAVDNWLPIAFAVGATMEINVAADPPEVREGTCPLVTEE